MQFLAQDHRARLAITVCYVLLASVIAGAAARVQGADELNHDAVDALILEQTEVPVQGYWASGSPVGITRSDGVYVVAETYVQSDPYEEYGDVDLHRYVDIKIEAYADHDCARRQYERVDRLFGTPIMYDGREYLRVDIERGVGVAYYVCYEELCIGFVTNDSESVLQQFIGAYWTRFRGARTAATDS